MGTLDIEAQGFKGCSMRSSSVTESIPAVFIYLYITVYITVYIIPIKCIYIQCGLLLPACHTSDLMPLVTLSSILWVGIFYTEAEFYTHIRRSLR